MTQSSFNLSALSLRLRGFTLVELLVVIGIIALLIGILLPVLGKARESANRARCAANMRSAAQAMQLYVVDSKGWLPGPHTSGRSWNSNPNYDNAPNYGVDSISPTEGTSDERPLQNMDWMSPTLGKAMALPTKDIERLKTLYEVNLYCPSNDVFFSDLAFNDEGVSLEATGIRYTSYSAVIHFHAWPQREATSNPKIDNQTSTAAITLNKAHAPQITKIGNPAEKAYLVEGARYVSGGGGASLNLARYQIVGGNFMIVGPWTQFSDGPYNLPGGSAGNYNWDGSSLSNINKTLAWRHGGRMNIAFFDGHVETLPVADTLPVRLYTPKGTRINFGNFTQDPDDSNGNIVN
jgi:prepilin-type processing-associated H-X9-DG protein/prepilin-type N-terminal cleavage/methylation domain-containing protein